MDSSLTKTCWSEVKAAVKKANPTVFGLIEDINPSDDMPLYIAEYPYGTIIDDGIFYYPDEKGVLRPRSDPGLPQAVRDDFGYAGENTPLGMVLDKMVETSTVTHEGICPWWLFKRGEFFALSGRLGTAESFAPAHAMSMTSGTRSIYMLPKIGDALHHQKLRKLFDAPAQPPKHLDEHWITFREISKHQSEEDFWSSSILLFPGKWLEALRNDLNWARFHLYLYTEAWDRNAFEINKRFYDLAFSKAQADRNLKPNPYLADTAKHLFAILAGGRPGFSIATSDDLAPVSFIEKVYREFYDLGCYSPQLLVPAHLGEETESVYYSLQAPTALEYSPRSRKDSSMLLKIREIKHIFEVVCDYLLSSQSELKGTKIAELIDKTETSFFNSKADKKENIHSSDELPFFEQNLNKVSASTSTLPATTGPFVRGCVLMRLKKQE